MNADMVYIIIAQILRQSNMDYGAEYLEQCMNPNPFYENLIIRAKDTVFLSIVSKLVNSGIDLERFYSNK